MSSEMVIAIGSAGISLLSVISAGVLSAWSANRTRRLEHNLEREQKAESDAEIAQRILREYRDPLLESANALQSRMYNILRQNYLGRYLHCGDRDEERYARDYTVYVIAEYLCWAEILRHALRFLDVANVEGNRELLSHVNDIHYTFLRDDLDPPFRVFRGRQRAIAEVMMTQVAAPDGQRAEAIGYALFCQRLDNDEEFRQWFSQLREDVTEVDRAGDDQRERLVELQRHLIDLIDFLDPDHSRLPTTSRTKLPSNLAS